MKKILLTAALAALALLSVIAYLNAPPAGMRDGDFNVARGESIRVIARNLEKSGLVKNRRFFTLSSRMLRGRYVRAGK
ncbi:MAG: hypothetical protein E4G96_03910 [Chrysiogenales bacterium]|nr:MAG: hypothetical protein E4G96_03910 [Chrysiogenales bacterium]